MEAQYFRRSHKFTADFSLINLRSVDRRYWTSSTNYAEDGLHKFDWEFFQLQICLVLAKIDINFCFVLEKGMLNPHRNGNTLFYERVKTWLA